MTSGEQKTTKKHWLYGVIRYNVDVTEETSCLNCNHRSVCEGKKSKCCENYDFGTSDSREACDGCVHRFYRRKWDKDGFPCFKCRFFEDTTVPTDVISRIIQEYSVKKYWNINDPLPERVAKLDKHSWVKGRYDGIEEVLHGLSELSKEKK